MTKSKMGSPVSAPSGDNLAARLRAAKGWSQEEMARELEVSRVAVSKWERGLVEPSGPVKKLMLLCLSELDANQGTS